MWVVFCLVAGFFSWRGNWHLKKINHLGPLCSYPLPLQFIIMVTGEQCLWRGYLSCLALSCCSRPGSWPGVSFSELLWTCVLPLNTVILSDPPLPSLTYDLLWFTWIFWLVLFSDLLFCFFWYLISILFSSVLRCPFSLIVSSLTFFLPMLPPIPLYYNHIL